MKEEFFIPILRDLRASVIRKYIKKGSIIADIGCGTEAQFLKTLDGMKERIGIDMKLTARKIRGIKLVKRKIAKKIPLKSNSVGCITMLAVLEHLDHPVDVIKDSYRILRDNGVLILTTPSKFSIPIVWTLANLGLSTPEEFYEHKYYFTKNHLKKILEDAGFRNIRVKRFQLGLNKYAVAYK